MSKTKVTVESPIALENGQLERIEAVLKKITSGDVMIENIINGEMLGGMRIKFGTKIIDLSLEEIIEEMENELDE